jgi:hypothetical protein
VVLAASPGYGFAFGVRPMNEDPIELRRVPGCVPPAYPAPTVNSNSSPLRIPSRNLSLESKHSKRNDGDAEWEVRD